MACKYRIAILLNITTDKFERADTKKLLKFMGLAIGRK